MFRSIALGGTKRLEFRVEGGNILNHPVFGNPDGERNKRHVHADLRNSWRRQPATLA